MNLKCAGCSALGLPFEFEQVGSASARLISSKDHAGGCGARHEIPFGVCNIAFSQTNCASAFYNLTGSAEFVFPNRAQEIDFKFQRSEGLTILEGGSKSNAHCGVGDVAKDPAVKCAHRVRVRVACFEFDRSFAVAYSGNMKPYEAGNRWFRQLPSNDFFDTFQPFRHTLSALPHRIKLPTTNVRFIRCVRPQLLLVFPCQPLRNR
jgi:hypothetical protein